MARIYKEGQGKWGRGLLVITVMIGAILALQQLHGMLPRAERAVELPLVGFSVDYRYLIEGPLLVLAAWFGYWLFNRPRTADFLIETESELKNKVSWPSQKEEVNASIVVVFTVLILAVFIFLWDKTFQFFSGWWYS